MRRLKPDDFPEEISVEDVVCFDDDVVVATEFSTDEEILAWVKREDAEKSDDEDEEEELVEIDAEVSFPTARPLASSDATHFAQAQVVKICEIWVKI